MSIIIGLTPDEERKLETLARERGKDPSAYIHDMVTAYLNAAEPGTTSTFEEILSPIWEGWRQSGMTEGEIDDLLRRELREVRRERRQHSGEL